MSVIWVGNKLRWLARREVHVELVGRGGRLRMNKQNSNARVVESKSKSLVVGLIVNV
jgi:hypothetical protein